MDASGDARPPQRKVLPQAGGGVVLNGLKGARVPQLAMHASLTEIEPLQAGSAHKTLDEATREALSAFDEAIQAAQVDVLLQLRALHAAQPSSLDFDSGSPPAVSTRAGWGHPAKQRPEDVPALCRLAITAQDSVLSQSTVPEVGSVTSLIQSLTEVLPGELPEHATPSTTRPVSVESRPASSTPHRPDRRVREPTSKGTPLLSSKKGWLFPDKTDLMEQVQNTLSKPDYKVTNFYHEAGLAQSIARSSIFETVTLVVIGLSSIWVAIDADQNTEPLQPPPGFVIVENVFCVFFFTELLIRWLAFAKKRDCLRDFWFVFDAMLVIITVLDTWVMALVSFLGGTSTTGLTGWSSMMPRLLRMARLARTARIVRLLRAVPEIMIMFKGMVVASHAVLCTIVLLTIIIYVFAITFRLLTMDSALGESYFRSVPWSMRTLLFRGALPDAGDFVSDLSDAHMLLGVFGVAFVVLAMLVVLNMLAGVLVNVVLVVADLEKEQADVTFVKNTLPDLLGIDDLDGDPYMCKEEFDEFLVNPEVAKVLSQVNVDILGLVELSDVLFLNGDGLLPFEDFFKLVLKLRGSNTATVKDIVEMRKFFVQEHRHLEQSFASKLEKILVKLGDPDTRAHQNTMPL